MLRRGGLTAIIQATCMGGPLKGSKAVEADH